MTIILSSNYFTIEMTIFHLTVRVVPLSMHGPLSTDINASSDVVVAVVARRLMADTVVVVAIDAVVVAIAAAYVCHMTF